METNDFLNAMQQETPKMTEEQPKISSGAEKTLIMLAKITLICGILVTIVFIVLFLSEIDDPDESIVFLICAISILFGTLISWSTMRIFANISITLKEILNKIK